MCVRPRQRLWGFSQLKYIRRQSPADTHTHSHIQLINMDTHTHIYRLNRMLMNINIFTYMCLTQGGIHLNTAADRQGWKLFFLFGL